MGLFSLFKRNTTTDTPPVNPSTPPAEPSPEKQRYYGDLEKTAILSQLFQTPHEQRDESWKTLFLANVIDASFACADPQVVEGPDSFPYFQLNTPETGKPFQCYVLRHMITDFLLDKGLGVVINATHGQPDWVFSYGDMVNFHLNQQFYTPVESRNLPAQEVIQEQETVQVGQPSESILPVQARNALREFMLAMSVSDPKLMLMNRQKPDGLLQEIVFNLTPDKFKSTDHYQYVMQNVGWFLPRHYSYVSMNESNFQDTFMPL